MKLHGAFGALRISPDFPFSAAVCLSVWTVFVSRRFIKLAVRLLPPAQGGPAEGAECSVGPTGHLDRVPKEI